jgi:hypothetical protein
MKNYSGVENWENMKLKGKNMSALEDLCVDNNDRKKINRLAVIWASVNAKRMTESDFFLVFRDWFPDECKKTWYDFIGEDIKTGKNIKENKSNEKN